MGNKNVYQFLHCWNALKNKNNSLCISGLHDNIYVNNCCHVGQNGIFEGDNVIHIRREEKIRQMKTNEDKVMPN